MKTKTKNIIQRLCLFLFVLVLAAPAWATNYSREGYEVFRSGETVKKVGKKSTVGTLKQGKVEITFSSCKTTKGTGSDAIYELAKGSRITVKADDGYSIRWIILRDTEGGKDYDHNDGIKRISRVTSGYDYYFEKNAITNSYISGGNKDNLNDDDNNIVVTQYDASAQSVEIRTHNNRIWDQFKVRDIIVGYVRSPKVRFERENYEMYFTNGHFKPKINLENHDGNPEYKVDNDDVADVSSTGLLKFKRPERVVLTATFDASQGCAKRKCSTTVTMKRDRVTFTADGLPDVLLGNAFGIHTYLEKQTTQSGNDFDYRNAGFSITSTNSNVLYYDKPWLKLGGTGGEVTITLKQKENNQYEAASLQHNIIVMRTDKNGTVLIKDAAEWKAFCKIVNEKGRTNLNAKLEADINLGGDIAMIGRYDHKYAGTFDGQNHTLTLNWNTGESDIAPFRRVDGATIKNLRTAGTIKSSGHFLAGLIDEASGDNNTISNCVSAVNITSSYTSDRCGAGGLISYIFPSARVTINDCLVKGSINATTEKGQKGMGGFVYVQNGACIMNNCLYAGTNNADNSNNNCYTFAPTNTSGATTTLNNCYYLNPCGEAQGTQVTAERLKSGEMAKLLQGDRTENVWGQTLGTDTIPQPTAEVAKQVYEVKFTLNNEVKAMRYANRGGHVSLPTVQELLGADYAPNITYALSFEGGFSASSTVTGNTTVVANVVFKDISIATKDDWKKFGELVRSGEGKLNARLTADIDLGGDFLKIGSESTGYSGTFDGQGHTITIDWNGNGGGYIALFPFVTDATIKNLRVTGQMTSDSEPLGVFAFEAGGNTTFSGCVSDVKITNGDKNDTYCAAGMVRAAYSKGKITFKDCIVAGDLNGTTDNSRQGMGGFVCGQADDATCTFDNCLYTGTNNSKGGYTFAPNPTLNNCYYLNPCGTAQGERIVEKQLKSGEVTKKLQGDRTDSCHWAQVLGEWPGLYCETDKAKPNYVYYNKENNGWTCDDFRLTDGQSLPIGLDFTAAKASYERTLAAGKATLCLPYDLPVQGFKAYTLADRQESRTAVHFKEVNGTLAAYRPYLLVADAPARLDGENLQVKADRSSIVLSAGNYYFKGAVHDVVNWWLTSDHAYILQADGQFHKVTSDNPSVTVPAYRAYISYNSHEGAKPLSIVFDGETTGIYGTTDGATDGAADGAVYNLQGQRVADRLDDSVRRQIPTGVYIVNGRKVIVK